MATMIRPELSDKNKYYVEKHRTYELRHFCMQYPIWKNAYDSLNALSKSNEIAENFPQYEDPTAQCAIAMEYYSRRMEMVETCCIAADPELSNYILKGVTEGCTYEHLKLKYDIPCSRDTYYDRYRKFFWILNDVRE